MFARWCDDERVFEGQFDASEEIIGRPIRLADVLLAIGKQKGHHKMSEGYNAGCFTLTASWEKESWNLKENDLTKQSPETIDFIHKLIV